jgi:hypothetical protein
VVVGELEVEFGLDAVELGVGQPGRDLTAAQLREPSRAASSLITFER